MDIINFLAVNMPVPRDILLPLPVWDWVLKILLVLFFLLHILFVNLMVGGSILTVIFEIIGKSFPRFDKLAQKIASTITVNKSLAVVLGVGPLLCINLVYTVQFYSANALTGHAWIMIVPLATLAFLLTYWHKYTWNSSHGDKKLPHIILGAFATFIFLIIPFIFLANINLMLFPDKWSEVQGFFSSLRIGNVFPRYFHFLAASIAITGLFLAGWFGRKSYRIDENLAGLFTHAELRRIFYHVAFWVTLAQFFFGPLLLLTLPPIGITTIMLVVIFAGVAIALPTLGMLWKEIKSSDDDIGKFYLPIVGLFSIIVLCMGTGRHLYREASLVVHKGLVERKTQEFRALEYATRLRLKAGLGAGDSMTEGPTGKSVFTNCAACHAVDTVLAAPALTEVYELYKDDPKGIVEWAKAPGKKRSQFSQMPSFAHLGDEQLYMVAEYMLQLGAEALGETDTESEQSDNNSQMKSEENTIQDNSPQEIIQDEMINSKVEKSTTIIETEIAVESQNVINDTD